MEDNGIYRGSEESGDAEFIYETEEQTGEE